MNLYLLPRSLLNLSGTFSSGSSIIGTGSNRLILNHRGHLRDDLLSSDAAALTSPSASFPFTHSRCRLFLLTASDTELFLPAFNTSSIFLQHHHHAGGESSPKCQASEVLRLLPCCRRQVFLQVRTPLFRHLSDPPFNTIHINKFQLSCNL